MARPRRSGDQLLLAMIRQHVLTRNEHEVLNDLQGTVKVASRSKMRDTVLVHDLRGLARPP